MIKGWVRTSLIDYPGQIASVLFTGGCNLRCPMCHNAALIEAPQDLPDIPVSDIQAELIRRKDRVTGIVISGGEPCLQAGLPDLLTTFKHIGMKIKLDTNGTRPDVIKNLLSAGLLDAVAMDIKAPPEKYPQVCGVSVDMSAIEETIRFLRTAEIWIEFRTTVVPGLLDAEDVHAIGEWLAGSPRYVLQQFVPQHCYADEFRQKIPLPAAALRQMAEAARPYFQEVHLRGV